jgi:hypothetical protein
MHWIDENWKLMDTLINFIELHGVYSGENLCKAFVAYCKEFNILTKI